MVKSSTVPIHATKTSTFGVTQVIRGWTEALTMMKPGGKWEIVVPQELAYGPGGKRPKIPPYSALRFEIELISVEQAKPARQEAGDKQHSPDPLTDGTRPRCQA